MDNIAIQDTIDTLLNSETTQNNVSELASLIIVNEYLNKQNLSRIQRELDDILPAYKKYVEVKRLYQLNEIDESAVVHMMKLTVQEIQEFIEALYSGTDMGKERREICHIISSLYEKYCK